MTIAQTIETDQDRWNDRVREIPEGHLMQTWEWGTYKSELGWKPYRIMISQNGKPLPAAQVLFKPVPLSPWSVGYIPKGPMIPLENREAWDCLKEGLSEIAAKEKAVVIRSEPSIANGPERREHLKQMGFHQTFQSNQPRCTIIVDLPGNEETLFSRFGRNNRRLINKAKHCGVQIRNAEVEEVARFYQLLEETARRKHLSEQNLRFYEKAFETFKKAGSAELLLAELDGETVGSLMIFFFKRQSMHLWAGNSEKGLKCQASYLLHWEGMKQAMKRGCTQTDLWGVPDEIAGMLENGEPVSSKASGGLWGLYRFKHGFQGNIQCYVGTYDLIYKPGVYRLMNALTAGQKTVDRVSAWMNRFST